jgi:hypothetical protein
MKRLHWFRTRPVLRLLVAAVAVQAAGAARAALIAYEGFDYAEPAGTSVGALNGGTGWEEAYPAPSGTVALQPGLSFPGITTSGQSMEFGANANLTSNGRNWGAAVTTQDYWYSFLMNPTTDGSGAVSRGTFGVLQNGTGGDNQNGFGIRYDVSGTTLTVNAQSRVQAPGTNIEFPNGFGDTYFVLGKLTVDMAGDTKNDIWVYSSSQSLPASEAAAGAPMSTVTGVTGTVFPALYGRAFSNSQPTRFDEIRVGETFASVTGVIPEPTSVALLMLGFVGLSYRRVRRAAPALALLACVCFTANASAELLMQESFDYDADLPIAGLDGGTGFAEAYDAGIGAANVVVGEPLSFPGFANTGNALKVAVNGNLGPGGRTWGPTPTAETEGEWWYSFLIHLTSNENPNTQALNTTRGTVSPFMKSAGLSNDAQDGHGLRIDNGLEGGAPGSDGQVTTAIFRALHPAGYGGSDSVVVPNGYDQTYFVLGNFTLTSDPGDPFLGIEPSQGTRTTIFVYSAADGLPTEQPVVDFANADPNDNQTTVYGQGVAATAFEFALGGRMFSFGGNGSAPSIWDEFRVGTEFADVLPPSGPLLGADFDADGDVDSADYAAWETGFGTVGTAVPADGDADGDGNVGGSDLLIWQGEFGSGSAPATAFAIPEPTTLLIGAIAAMGWGACYRRR